MRTDIDKEEISRSIRNQGRDEINKLDSVKQKELQNLSNQREQVRIKEKRISDEVMAMEQELYKKEQYFKKQEESL